MLDADAERLGFTDVQAVETEGLIGTGAAAAVLAYLFHRIEDRLEGRPTLLYYSDEGRAQPRVQKAQHPVQWHRADVSVGLFHLNHKDAVEERLELFNRIKKLVSAGRI